MPIEAVAPLIDGIAPILFCAWVVADAPRIPIAAAAANRRDVIQLSPPADRPDDALRTGRVISSAVVPGARFSQRRALHMLRPQNGGRLDLHQRRRIYQWVTPIADMAGKCLPMMPR